MNDAIHDIDQWSVVRGNCDHFNLVDDHPYQGGAEFCWYHLICHVPAVITIGEVLVLCRIK
jgi:hypothetical protein